MSLVKKIQNTVFQQELFKKGDKIVLAISGGPDSVSMLDIFFKLRKKYALEIILAHVNYRLRGKDSERDEKFVRQISESLGLKIVVEKPRLKKGKTSEDYLRKIRYDLLEKIRLENKFDHIAVAHNADDQVETFLMRIIRGAGLQGLSAMRHRNGHIIRPLLDVTRPEIIQYLKEKKLEYRTDKTNLESNFLRNKIRNKLLPILEKNFNPSIRQTIRRAAATIAEDYAFMQELEKLAIKDADVISVKALLVLHPAMQKRTLRRWLAAGKNDLKDIGAAHIAEILKMAKSTKNKAQFVILAGLKIRRRGDKLYIEKKLN